MYVVKIRCSVFSQSRKRRRKKTKEEKMEDRDQQQVGSVETKCDMAGDCL
jgi:hypothetical protein